MPINARLGNNIRKQSLMVFDKILEQKRFQIIDSFYKVKLINILTT